MNRINNTFFMDSGISRLMNSSISQIFFNEEEDEFFKGKFYP